MFEFCLQTKKNKKVILILYSCSEQTGKIKKYLYKTGGDLEFLLIEGRPFLNKTYLLKLTPVEAESTQSNEKDNFLPVEREDDLSPAPMDRFNIGHEFPLLLL